jgi:hypothetical protein
VNLTSDDQARLNDLIDLRRYLVFRPPRGLLKITLQRSMVRKPRINLGIVHAQSTSHMDQLLLGNWLKKTKAFTLSLSPFCPSFVGYFPLGRGRAV